MNEKAIEDMMALYLAKAKEFNFKPDNVKTVKGRQRAVVYLLTTGCIPVNAENLALTGKEEFHVSADHLPDALKKTVLEASEKLEENWNYDEEAEDEELKVISTNIDGVWIKQGKVTTANIARQREVRVTTTFTTPELNIKV